MINKVVKEKDPLRFLKVSQAGHETEYRIESKKEKVFLGTIKWQEGWGTYSFNPAPNRVFDDDCLVDIAEYMIGLRYDRERPVKDDSKNPTS